MQQFHSHFSIADFVSSLLVNEVVVRAIIGTLEKNVFNTDRSLKSSLNFSPLKKKKKP